MVPKVVGSNPITHPNRQRSASQPAFFVFCKRLLVKRVGYSANKLSEQGGHIDGEVGDAIGLFEIGGVQYDGGGDLLSVFPAIFAQ